ncbi:isoamyl acetate-hydrolyzing esterase [Marasmius crinis-equi]|uniref:Isoamyl acetate-hydrolyzing esterase n=1 Tax=Marasmius crinis-equi TaxID=585013 RepID=A0ABR3FXW6_9AGAR
MASNIYDCMMLFGDSITQHAWDHEGFGAKLANAYSRKLDVLNRGLSGYNTDWAMPVFEKIFARGEQRKHALKVRLLVIWFGANDSCIKPSPQHVPITKFISNLKHLVNLVQSPKSEYYSPDTKIILITPPPVNTFQRKADLESRTPPQELDRLFETTKRYAEAVKDAASEEEVAVVDIWSAFWDGSGHDERNLSKFLTDGLHLNKEGYTVVYEQLLATIGKNYPELHPDAIEYVFPRWDEVAAKRGAA